MKRHLLLGLIALISLGGATALTSCSSDSDSTWSPAAPYGWKTFYDSRLIGTWALVQADGETVTGDQVNYLSFLGQGKGQYYYYSQGQKEQQDMRYFCQLAGDGMPYQINIQYADGSASTMNYWFSGTRLYMEWQTASGQDVTYVYTNNYNTPW